VGLIIPDDIANFIEERIDSVATLEGLLILRQDPQKKWNARSLADWLYIHPPEAAQVLQVLLHNDLAVSDGNEDPGYSYAPQTPERRDLLDRLAGIYSRHVVPIANLIHAKPKHKVQGFADAFKLRKDRDD